MWPVLINEKGKTEVFPKHQSLSLDLPRLVQIN